MSFYGLEWSGWSKVPGEGKTPAGLSAVADVAGCEIALACLGSRFHVFCNLMRGGTWGTWVEVPGNFQTKIAPCAASLGGNLCLYVVGEDELVYFNSTNNGTHWVGWKKVSGVAKTRTPLCAAPGGSLYLVDLDGTIFVNQNPTTAAGAWTKVQPVFKTSAGLCATPLNFPGTSSDPVLFCKGLDDENIWYLLPGSTAWFEVSWGVRVQTDMALTAALNFQVSVWLFCTGRDNEIYASFIAEPDLGIGNWGKVPVMNDNLFKTDAAPAAVGVVKGDGGESEQVFLFAKGFNNEIYVNVAQVIISSFTEGEGGPADGPGI